jgi:hypothetical protein
MIDSERIVSRNYIIFDVKSSNITLNRIRRTANNCCCGCSSNNGIDTTSTYNTVVVVSVRNMHFDIASRCGSNGKQIRSGSQQ